VEGALHGRPAEAASFGALTGALSRFHAWLHPWVRSSWTGQGSIEALGEGEPRCEQTKQSGNNEAIPAWHFSSPKQSWW
jgi:hypothetical protein